jgi:hypothetical protein
MATLAESGLASNNRKLLPGTLKPSAPPTSELACVVEHSRVTDAVCNLDVDLDFAAR